MGSLTSQLILRLVDQLSGPAGKAGAALSKTAADVNKLGSSLRAQQGSAAGLRASIETAIRPTDRLGASQRKLRADVEAANRALRSQAGGGGGGGLIAGIGARGLALAGGAYGVARTVTSAITSYADLDRRMRRVGLTADATTAQVTVATASVKDLAMQTATPLDDVVKGLEALVAQGRSLPESMSFLPAVTRTAQAAGAEVEDIAKSADALASHLKIASGDMQAAFDVLVAGGKAGSFELRDMARYLPSLAPAAKALGLEGQRGLESIVSMLQVIRKGSGTSEEAAASMNNILQKMNSDETLKRFKKAGVDLEAAFKKGRKEGQNLLEVFENATWAAIKGDLSQLPRVINDMEFARGMRAILSMRGAWQDMAQTIRQTAAGSTMRDFNAVAEDSKARIERLTQAWGNFKTSLGETVAPPIVSVLETLQKKLDDLRKESDRSSLSERRTAGRDAYMAEAGRGTLVDENGKYIGPRSSGGSGLSWIGRLLNPETYGAGKPGQRNADLDAARWRGVQAAIAARIAAENDTLAAPGRIEEFIRRQEGLREASRSRANGLSGMAAVTAREQVRKAEAEIARLRGELAAAQQKAADVAAKRAAAPGEIAALRSKQLSGAFGIDGPTAGTAPGTVSPGLLNFGLEGVKRQANETRAALDELGNPVHANLDSSDIARALELARALNAELRSIGANAATATSRAAREIRNTMRASYSDWGSEASG